MRKTQALYTKSSKELSPEELKQLKEEGDNDLDQLIDKWKLAGMSKNKVFQLIFALYPDEVDDNE